ncbi:uncharacterized protein DUF2849 [Roseibium hamelinense]|uniref:Uncharacterized protein DUF2849 n=1 Tax=Roseibium hamelinense TaxID=150831 RepID=A0A562T1H4_9HYPH|nr:DUF2849 domain-containing protein [Roseibium hamelinense]MTI44532.1 DUF2849 domain-containing protein [Roseibium hamelinense]TWI87501.1 uncharacterized protein DUF2849 [Roseibium hamelinense]
MKVITANRLLDGEVVWLGAEDLWVDALIEAKMFDGKEATTAALAVAAQAVADQKIVGPYDMDVTIDEDGIVPVRLRERIRAAGPTTHPQFRKQAASVRV